MTSQRSRFQLAAACLGLAAITWFVFGQSLHYGFVNYDDPEYVADNPHVKSGLTTAGVTWALTHAHGANWHPLTSISHMLDCQIYGLQPWGHHLTNLVLHGTTAILLFLLLLKMTDGLWRSAFVAALFAIHPLRAESVVWVSERKDVLSALFFMLTVLAYLRYARQSSVLRYLFVCVLFALGLMAKPMLVTLPVTLLLLDFWPLHRIPEIKWATLLRNPTRRLLLEKLPLVALSIAASIATVFAQKLAIRPFAQIPLGLRLENAVMSYTTYIGQMFWPVDLAVFYPFQQISAPQFGIALGFLVVASAVIFFLRRRRYLVTGWLWYLVMLLPVIGIVQVGDQAHADRYTLLPEVGLYLLFTWSVSDLCAAARGRSVLLTSVGTLILGAAIFLARTQVSYWRDSETLWRHALSVTVPNVTADKGLGDALRETGRAEEAIKHYRDALTLAPNHWPTHLNLAVALRDVGQMAESVAQLQKTIEINPTSAEAEWNLGVILLSIGRTHDSLAHLLQAVALEPSSGTAHYNLGNTLLALGRDQEAATRYAFAVQLDPSDFEAATNMAWLLATSPDPKIRDGQKAVALASHAAAVIHEPNVVVQDALAAAYAEAGRFDDAVRTAREALELARVQNDLARVESTKLQLRTYESGSPFRTPLSDTSGTEQH